MLLSKEEWKEVQKASEAGLEDEELSRTYGVSKASIKMRRMREKWMTPNRIRAEIAASKARADSMRIGNGQAKKELAALGDGNVTTVTKPALEAVSESLLEDGKASSILGMRLLKGLLERAAKDPESLESLETASDVVTAVKGARLIAGLDREGSSVTLNLGAFWEAPVEGSGLEAEKPLVVREIG